MDATRINESNASEDTINASEAITTGAAHSAASKLFNIKNTVSTFVNEIRENFVIILTFGDIKKSLENDFLFGSRSKRTKTKRSSFRENSYHEEIPTFNGLIASIEIFVLLMTFVVIILLTPYLGSNKNEVPTKATLTAFMIIGIFIMLNFSINKNKYLILKKKVLGMRGQLVLIGIIMLFTLGSFKDLSHSAMIVNCLSVYYKCGREAAKRSTLSLIFHISKIAYLAIQTTFCFQYRNHIFVNRFTSQFGLMFLLASNLGIWFDTILRHSASNMHSMYYQNYSSVCNLTDFNDTVYASIKTLQLEDFDTFTAHSKDYRCVYITGRFSDLITKYIDPITFPFLFQYSVLVLECYVYWLVYSGFFSSKKSDGGRLSFKDTKTNKEVGTEVVKDCRIRARNLVSSYNPSHGDDLNSSNSLNSSNQDSGSFEITPSSRGKSINYEVMLRKCVTLIIVINLLFVLFDYAPNMVQDNEEEMYDRIRDYFLFAFWTLSTFLTFLGYYCSTTFDETRKKKKFRSMNYLLIISAVGQYVYAITAVSTILKMPEWQRPSSIYSIILEKICFSVLTFVQIPFCFLAGKVMLPNKNLEKTFKVNCFKTIVLHLAVSNGMMWLVDSFAIYRHSNTDIQIKVLDLQKWTLIRNIVFPLSILFRFNSCLLFTAAFVRMTSSSGKTKTYYLS